MTSIIRILLTLTVLWQVATHAHWSVTVVLICSSLRAELNDWLLAEFRTRNAETLNAALNAAFNQEPNVRSKPNVA